jgi:predicted RNA binding protein YcfA (HicA-like mRNA interferase family)
MDYSPKKIISLLEKKGFVLRRITGSHHIYFHKEEKKIVVVPVHGNKDHSKRNFYEYFKTSRYFKKRTGVE